MLGAIETCSLAWNYIWLAVRVNKGVDEGHRHGDYGRTTGSRYLHRRTCQSINSDGFGSGLGTGTGISL